MDVMYSDSGMNNLMEDVALRDRKKEISAPVKWCAMPMSESGTDWKYAMRAAHATSAGCANTADSLVH